MTTTITLLVDNRAETGLKHEHGLSVLIEQQGKRILFDNGQNDALFYNAEKLATPLHSLDLIILSHGHYDHGGNLARLLDINPDALFYAHPDCMQTRYSLHPNKAPRTISLTKTVVEAIEAFPDNQKKFITSPTEICSGIWLTGQIPRLCEIEDTGGPFFLDKEKKQVDQLNDDMSLWIETEDGLTVICGCCHSGIINTLNYIKQQTGEAARINNLLGGLHLVNANQQRLNGTIDYLNKQHIETIYPAHCTGDNSILLLKKQFKNKLQTAKAGLQLTL
ncbi:MBL fold metallo-hydrolase [Psychromonas sp.]|uniref:MBL fold metallo-hydrolase n=1 Tax=Psychromonas sp. TaxID=1884585 RepID=UPI0039E3DE48